MASQTSATINHDGNNVPAEGFYVPSSTVGFPAGTGVTNALGGSVVTDANNNTATASVTQLGDRSNPQQWAAVDSYGALSVHGANPVIVQKNKAVSTGSVASLAASFANAVTAGNSIIVVAGCGNGTAMTVADTLSNTYTQAVNAPNSTTFEAAIFYAVGVAAGTPTITVTNAGSAASMAVEIYEVQGLVALAGAQPAQNSKGTGTGTTASTSALAALPNSLAFLGVAVGTAAQAVSASAGTFWTLDSTQNSAGTPAGLFTFGALSQSFGGIGGVVPQATIAGSEPWAAAAAVFRPIALPVQGSVHIAGYTKTNITTGTTTLVKTGPGTLHAIAINKLVASATIEYDDAVTNTNSMGIITLPGTITALAPFVMPLDIDFTTGLSITTSGATDVTIIWR